MLNNFSMYSTTPLAAGSLAATRSRTGDQDTMVGLVLLWRAQIWRMPRASSIF